jgi:hypothetical protein
MAEIEINFDKYGDKFVRYEVHDDILEYIEYLERLLIHTEDELEATLDFSHKSHSN